MDLPVTADSFTLIIQKNRTIEEFPILLFDNAINHGIAGGVLKRQPVPGFQRRQTWTPPNPSSIR